MQEGITITEACAKNVIGTKEDFERLCNPDGTVKEHAKTTTISLKNSDNSVTIHTAYLQIGLVVLLIAIALLSVYIVKKFKRAR